MTSTDQHTKALGHLAETATSLTATVGSHNVQIAALGVILSALLDEAAADPQRAERLKALVGQQARSHARLKTDVGSCPSFGFGVIPQFSPR